MLCDGEKSDVNGMIELIVRENSSFIDEGKNLLIEELGKNYATYFSILSAVSGVKNTQPEIEDVLGNKSKGGQIKRLIEDYNLLSRQRPILSKENTYTVRYEIHDCLLRFWFNYFDRHCSLIEIKNYKTLQEIIKSDYPTYSGKLLEYFSNRRWPKAISTE